MNTTKRLSIIVSVGIWIAAAVAAQQPAIKGQIRVVESSEDRHTSLEEQPAIAFDAGRVPELTITVNDAVRYQAIDGFGASLTDSSAWLLWNKLNEAQRKETLEKLFDTKNGIGLSMLRQPMGASDFALEDYSYDDVPTGEADP